ncbi:glycosyltransferase like family 2-domain-containing protein, partial [Podospora didyma]
MVGTYVFSGRPRVVANLIGAAMVCVALHQVLKAISGKDWSIYWFLILFTWRYLRLAAHLISFWCYKPARLKRGAQPTYTPNRDVTVILPTIDPRGEDFQECLRTCAENSPAAIIIVTAGDELRAQTVEAVEPYIAQFPQTRFQIERTFIASKRAQVALVVPFVTTRITVMLDDHVFWGPSVLQSVLLPFENPKVGMIGTNKKARRLPNLNPWRRLWNVFGALYLERHNFEIRASNAIDGGVFVVSARTCAMRTEILQHPEYLPRYQREMFFFEKFGPLNPDDDNYNTRFVVRHGWQVKIQYTPESEVETTVGVANPVHKKFLSQCQRWARTTWRSNSCSLFTDRSIWEYQPWCVYAVFLTSFTNFALFIDAGLAYLLMRTPWYTAYPKLSLVCLAGWILLAKLVKVWAYFTRYLQDIWLFPFHLLFGYFHSFLKLWALLTFWDCAWSGRNLSGINVDNGPDDDDNNGNDQD